MVSRQWCLAALLGLVILVLVGCRRGVQVSVPPGPDPGPPDPANPAPTPQPGTPPPPPLPLEEREPHAAGKKVYNASGCVRCHTMGGGGGPQVGVPPMPPRPGGPPAPPPPPPGGPPPRPNKGPDLAKAASKPERTVDWFVAFVGNPRKDNPDSRMPPFEGQIKPDDMRALAEFLASLK